MWLQSAVLGLSIVIYCELNDPYTLKISFSAHLRLTNKIQKNIYCRYATPRWRHRKKRSFFQFLDGNSISNNFRQKFVGILDTFLSLSLKIQYL